MQKRESRYQVTHLVEKGAFEPLTLATAAVLPSVVFIAHAPTQAVKYVHEGKGWEHI